MMLFYFPRTAQDFRVPDIVLQIMLLGIRQSREWSAAFPLRLHKCRGFPSVPRYIKLHWALGNELPVSLHPLNKFIILDRIHGASMTNKQHRHFLCWLIKSGHFIEFI